MSRFDFSQFGGEYFDFTAIFSFDARERIPPAPHFIRPPDPDLGFFLQNWYITGALFTIIELQG